MQQFTLNNLTFIISEDDQHLLALVSGKNELTFYLNGIRVGIAQGNIIRSETKSLAMLPETTFELWLKFGPDFDNTGDTVIDAICKAQNIVP